MNNKNINDVIQGALLSETQRQHAHIELIASENFVSEGVLELQGSILTNKYAEGYPKQRYYGGCENVDVIEQLAIDKVKQMFNVLYANVQPHSGSQANMAAILALINPGDKILGMSLNEGGHLTHGYHLNFSGKLFKTSFYGVNEETLMIDYDEVLEIAKREKPKLIICGASAYSRTIDFAKFREIADEVGAYLMADIAHIAGLIVANLHPTPVGYADVITSTTHKTLRGPRGGIILTNDSQIAKKVNRSLFPGTQGGPLMHVIAAKAQSFDEALRPSFKEYQQQVVKNAKTLSNTLIELGYSIASGGTDNHLMLVDVKSKHNITGFEAEKILGSVNITCNKNALPFDTEKPKYTSGIRLGTPAVTTRGFKEEQMVLIANLIDQALTNKDDANILSKIKNEVIKITSGYPLFSKEESK